MARSCKLDVDLCLAAIFADKDWMFKVGLGGMALAAAFLLLAINPLLMPLVLGLIALVSGYLLRVMRFKFLDNQSPPPDWDNWLELFMSGLTWLAIQFGLAITLTALVTTQLLIAARLKIGHPAFFPSMLLASVIVIAVWLVLDFCTPFLMVNFAARETLTSGLSFAQVFRRASSNPPGFLTCWLLCTGLKWTAIIVPAITVVGAFMIPSTLFMAQLISAGLCVQVWGPEKD